MDKEVDELLEKLLETRVDRKPKTDAERRRKNLDQYYKVYYLNKLIAEMEGVKVKVRALIASDEEYAQVCELLDSVVSRLAYTRFETRMELQTER
ncbi:MAG: hypothetical protein ACFFAY_05050 [Promethearchaeota archaeon]